MHWALTEGRCKVDTVTVDMVRRKGCSIFSSPLIFIPQKVLLRDVIY